MNQDYEKPVAKNTTPPVQKKFFFLRHYHGDRVRELFMLAGLIMIVSFPFFNQIIFLPSFFSVLGIIVIAFLAGLESPEKRWVLILNTAIASLGCLIFEYQAAQFYSNSTTDTATDQWFFWVNQALAIIFFLALYFSAKTLRVAKVPVK